MGNKGGVWIDHRKAVVVVLSDGAEHHSVILSKVEKHLERGGDSPLEGRFEARQVPADDSQQRSLTAKLNIFYDEVIVALANLELIVLFGPGEAKHELDGRLKKLKRDAHVEPLETEDKMTDPQIIAKVRSHFGVGAARAQPLRK